MLANRFQKNAGAEVKVAISFDKFLKVILKCFHNEKKIIKV
jgi:hypothetical protein